MLLFQPLALILWTCIFLIIPSNFSVRLEPFCISEYSWWEGPVLRTGDEKWEWPQGHRYKACPLERQEVGLKHNTWVRLQDGGGVRRGDHLPPHKYIRHIYMWNNSYRIPTEHWQKASDLPKARRQGCASEVGEPSSGHWSTRDLPAPRNIKRWKSPRDLYLNAKTQIHSTTSKLQCRTPYAKQLARQEHNPIH